MKIPPIDYVFAHADAPLSAPVLTGMLTLPADLREHLAALYRVAKNHSSCSCGWRIAVVGEKSIKVEMQCARCRTIELFEASPYFAAVTQPAEWAVEDVDRFRQMWRDAVSSVREVSPIGS